MSRRVAQWVRRWAPPGPLRSPGRTSPVTLDRVDTVLADRGYEVRREDDEALTGLWGSYLFAVRLTGSSGGLLSVVGFWGRQVPPVLRSSLAQAVNDWNRDKLWPTVMLDHDGLGVRTEVVTDFGVGATDAQIAEALETGLSSGMQMLDALSAAMPPCRQED